MQVSILEMIFILGFFNTTIVVCFKKWGCIDWYAARRLSWMPKADCYLCMGFWLAWLQIGILIIISAIQNPLFNMVPFCAAPVTNYLTNIALIHDLNKKR